MNPVSVVDLVGFLAVLMALIILWRGWKRALGRDAKLLLAVLLALTLFHGFSNVLEWSRITQALDPFEDFIEILEPLLWCFFLYAFLQEIDRVHSAAWESAHDRAFAKAVEQAKPHFVQCPRCNKWVCKENCWNVNKGLCKDCAPDLGVEMAAAQASRTVEEIWAHSKVAEEDREMLKEKSWREGVRATCPNCNAPLAANVKFCPECGAPVKAEKFCTECGSKIPAGVKFCPECGAKQ